MDKRETFINENTGLVHACVKRFKNKGIEYDDLFQAGMIGLIKAYDNFDKSLGYKFSTYAVPVILGEIKHIFREGSLVKVSRSLKDLSMKISRECNSFSLKNGRSPTLTELADILNTNEEKIVQALEASQPAVSLSIFSSQEGDTEFCIDIPTDENYEQISDKIALRQAIASLGREEKILIIMRFFRNKTQSETAEILGTTQVQISRREKKILAGLRQSLG